jgi:hypothetical protein
MAIFHTDESAEGTTEDPISKHARFIARAVAAIAASHGPLRGDAL